MYVPFSRSEDDVTFRLSLRHLFVRGWNKKINMEHNLEVIIISLPIRSDLNSKVISLKIYLKFQGNVT